MSDQSSNNVFKNLMNQVIFKINCYYCGNRFKKNINIKDENENEINSTSAGSFKNFLNLNSKFLNKFELEFLPYGDINKKKGRKKWTKYHNETLCNCLKLFGKNIQIIKKFLPKFSENILLKQIDKLQNNNLEIINKNIDKNYENNLDEMIESFGDMELDSLTNKKVTLNENFKEFSIDYFMEINKIKMENTLKQNSNNLNYSNNENSYNKLNQEDFLFFDKTKINIQNDFDDENIENEINSIFNKKINMNNKFSLEDVINNSISSIEFN